MRNFCRVFIITFLALFFSSNSFAQLNTEALIKRMRQHENNILFMYLEYQKLYYEDKSRIHELQAFEDLLSVYIDQVTEIYETLSLSVKKTEVPRDITARTLIFKALMFLEKAPLNREYFERACYSYYEALNLYDNANSAPVIYKDLPQEIIAGNKTYYRLKDLLDDKGLGLQDFGKVRLSFQSFMVTANFDPEMLELFKLNNIRGKNKAPEPEKYTYLLAENRIKDTFEQVFREKGDIETYVSLPAGTYLLRLFGDNKAGYTALTRFYVRPNQEHHYILEPLADWIVLYENPNSKRPDYYKFRRTKSSLITDSFDNSLAMNSFSGSSNGTNGHAPKVTPREELVGEIVSQYLPQFEIKMMVDLNDPEIKENATEIISKSIVEYVDSADFYNKWNHWSASWDISETVRDVISPGSLVPISLMELIYKTISEL